MEPIGNSNISLALITSNSSCSWIRILIAPFHRVVSQAIRFWFMALYRGLMDLLAVLRLLSELLSRILLSWRITWLLHLRLTILWSHHWLTKLISIHLLRRLSITRLNRWLSITWLNRWLSITWLDRWLSIRCLSIRWLPVTWLNGRLPITWLYRLLSKTLSMHWRLI